VDAIHFLNLEYFLLLVYQAFTGASAHVDISQVPTQTLELMTRIAWTGISLAVIFGVGLAYAYTRLHEVEHAGWHKRQEQEYAIVERHSTTAPKNSQWARIVAFANSPQESDWRRAIMEADIMLGNLLMSLGYRGASVGDMLKDANPIQFTTLDLAWSAHKIRNEIAHAGDSFILTERQTSATIDMYRRVFEEFDFI